MNVLVIGGNRFFGKTLVTILAAENHNVWVLNRGSHRVVYPEGVTHIKADRSNTSLLKDCIEKNSIDVVYDQVLFDSIQATEVVDLLSKLQIKVPRYIFTSTQSVYGPGVSLSESDFEPVGYTFSVAVKQEDDYSEAKRQAESVLFNSPFKDKVCAVRFPIVIGSDDYTGRFDYHVDALMAGKEVFFPNLDASISFIHSDDAAMCLNRLCEHSFVGPINMCTPRPIKLINFLNILETETGGEFILGTDPHRNYSPYAIGSDWWMDTGRMQEMGLVLKDVPDIIHQILQETKTD